MKVNGLEMIELSKYQGGFGIVEVSRMTPFMINMDSKPPILKDSDKKNYHLRWNKYNTIKIIDENKYCIYNCLFDKLVVMVRDVMKLITDNVNSIWKIAIYHPDLYNALLNEKFIVDDDFDEVKCAINKLDGKLRLSDTFNLIINPTLDCNLRCWYCYESHQRNSSITNETFELLQCLIKNKIESSQVKEMRISFFGGEPLMKFNRVVLPIIKYAQKICDDNNKKISIDFTTNGVLLNKNIVDLLYSLKLPVFFQIPFDGNRLFHDNVKKTVNGNGTFDLIIENIMYALSKGFAFKIRCNYTTENIVSFNELLSIFSEYASVCIEYGLLEFDFQRVWQEDETDDINEKLRDLKSNKILQDIDEISVPNYIYEFCYADSENSIVVNYNGDVFNCTARDFDTKYREGFLSCNGEIVYNERYFARMESRFSNENCLHCKIFPICNICSQKKLEMQKKDACVRNITEDQKEELLLNRIFYLITKND